nr:pilin [Pseudomonas sp. s4]
MKYILKALLVLAGIIAASIFYLLYSTHSSYYQGVRSTEPYKHAKSITASLSEYYSIHLKYPNNIEELNLENPDLHYVGKITFDNQAGVIKIQLAGHSLSEGILIFSPEIKNNNHLSYTCEPLNVPTEYIPKECTAKEHGSDLLSQPPADDAD